MPTEHAPPPAPPAPGPSFHPSQLSSIKCSLCGAGGFPSATSRSNEGVVVLLEPVERICGGCVRGQETARREESQGIGLGLGMTGVGEEKSDRAGDIRANSPDPLYAHPIRIHPTTTPSPPSRSFAQSLPNQHTRPWTTAPPSTLPIPEEREWTPSPQAVRSEEVDRPPNPLLDVTKARIPSIGRGALYPGSIFRGTQTSGRSAYEVEVRLLDVNFPEATLSGYLSISHLTDAHPHLTTFFTGELIGPKNGFITGSRFGATEHDDMRHWGRFEQFRRPSTRADMIRPEMLFRDPLPDRNRGETKAKERDFVFLRIKERFLVPDHTVRDISGASFAGFYFAMVDFAPTLKSQTDTVPVPTSPIAPKSPLAPTSPTVTRRMSSSGDVRSPSRPDGMRRRRETSNKTVMAEVKERGEVTIRGYYFHSLNQEPFQELYLNHVPARSSGTFELR